jgi:hypothetical protein
MSRTLYRALVSLHPPAFRREFEPEMLWIYEEAAPERGGAALVLDAFLSLARQWLLRSGCWKALAGLAVAVCQVALAGAFVRSAGSLEHGVSRANPLTIQRNPELAALMTLTAITAIGLLAAVMFLVLWWRGQTRRARV